MYVNTVSFFFFTKLSSLCHKKQRKYDQMKWKFAVFVNWCGVLCFFSTDRVICLLLPVGGAKYTFKNPVRWRKKKVWFYLSRIAFNIFPQEVRKTFLCTLCVLVI